MAGPAESGAGGSSEPEPEVDPYITPPETAVHGISAGFPSMSGVDESTSEFTRHRSTAADGDDLSAGTILLGKYQVVRTLGAGGLGRVYLVRHLKLDAERALKTILPKVAEHPTWRQRFGREAKAMARLSHPHIVAVHDADVLPDGQAFIEMEYVRGGSLDKRLEPGVPMPLDRVDRLLGQLASALQFAHDRGIIHRDLKPGNLILQDGGEPGQETLKVLDFGIAKILDSDDPSDDLTGVGESIGTPSYMSPEQIRGGQDPETGTIAESDGVDARSDVYAVGVILYQLLTGHLPFVGNRMVVFLGHLNDLPPRFSVRNPNAAIPARVEALVRRCLEKDPAKRPRSIREVADEFHRLVAPAEEPGSRIGRRTVLGLVAGGLAALALVGYLLFRPIRAPLPDGFVAASGSKLVEVLDGRSYPDRIVRELPGGFTAEFVLIPVTPGGNGPAAAYYILRDKVPRGLFAAFLDARPEAAPAYRERLEKRANSAERPKSAEDPRWPAYGMTVAEAQAFATWLVPAKGGFTANLPTPLQWDKAAGALDTASPDEFDPRGPFLKHAETEPDAIAIHRDEPLPVGTAKADLSRHGCRDMAGNGLEWTRPDPSDPEQAKLRGEVYDRKTEPTPYLFTFPNEKARSSETSNPPLQTSFRVVIEGLEQAGTR